MLPWLIWGVLAMLGTAAVISNWDDFVDWFRDFLRKLKTELAGNLKQAARTAKIFAELVISGGERLVKFIHRMSYRQNGKDCVKTTTRSVPEEEVPAEVREKIRKQKHGQADVTPEMKQPLQLEE